jgi:hypothetical protein
MLDPINISIGALILECYCEHLLILCGVVIQISQYPAHRPGVALPCPQKTFLILAIEAGTI